jgi:signal transduction histidine kinase/FixJ family two-component response regulator/HPt (histidine-containing phosphotransfer) domain-containing protein
MSAEPLLKRYRKSAIAFLIFIAYAMGVLFYNLHIQQRLEQNLLDSARLELEKDAGGLSYYFSERRNDLADLATSEVIANYFSSRDMGMSVEYGLSINIQAIVDKFEHLLEQKRLGGMPIYGQIALIDEAGHLIGQSGTANRDGREDFTRLGAHLGDAPGVTLLDSHDQLRFTSPVKLKGKLRGHVIAYSPVVAMEGRAVTQKTRRPQAILITATGEPISRIDPEVFLHPETMQLFAGMRFRDTRQNLSLPTASGDRAIAAIKQGIDGSPLSLSALITKRELEAQSIPSLLLVAVGTVPLAVMFIVILELRQRRRVEQAHENARTEAERLARVRSEFLANMSHEIRTPLNAILGLAQLGQRSSSGRQAEHQFVRIIESGQHLLALINDILDCSKIEAGKLSVERIGFDPGKVIDSAVTLTAERAFTSGLRFEINEQSLPVHCEGDPLRLSQVLVNLLGNAIKFTASGSVSLDAKVDGNLLQLQISDTGIGMSVEQIGRLFRPFEQADGSTTRRFGGTGLGLSISARIVAAMGGEIQVSSTPGVGSTFSVRIPLVAPRFDEGPIPAGPIVLAGFPPEESGKLTNGLKARGIQVSLVDAPGAALAADALIVVDARFADGAPAWRDWLGTLRASGQHTALAGRIEEIDGAGLPGSLSGRLPLIERPLRVRHFVDCLRAAPSDAVSSAIAASTDLAGYNVLAVDDNEINRMVLVSLLEHEGARVDCTNSGAATLARLQQVGTEHYDIILTDIQMPGMDGYELTRRIHEQHPALPILGLTAHADEETRARCLAAGMLAHIPKPISLDLLITEVCRHSRRPSTPRTGSATMPATAPSPKTTTPAGMVDWSALETQFRGKASFVTRLADKALINYRTNAIRLRALAAGQGELSELSFVAHSIKGTAGTLKATAVYELAAATDQAAREGSPDSRSLAAELADQLDELTLELEARVRG